MINVSCPILLTLFVFACAKKGENVQGKMLCKDAVAVGVEIRETSPTDTLLIVSSCAMLIDLTVDEIRDLKYSYKDTNDFYIIADDVNFYTAIARNFLDSANLEILNVSRGKILNFNGDYFVDTKEVLPWWFILYKKGDTPRIMAPIDVPFLYKKYYASIDECDSASFASGYYVLDSLITSLNDDKYPDKILALENRSVKNVVNHQRYAITFMILRGRPGSRFVFWKKNNLMLRELGYNCPAGGFTSLQRDGGNFVIDQVTCSDFKFRLQSFSFGYDHLLDDIVLRGYSESYINRADPTEELPSYDYTEKDFGRISFESFSDDSLLRSFDSLR